MLLYIWVIYIRTSTRTSAESRFIISAGIACVVEKRYMNVIYEYIYCMCVTIYMSNIRTDIYKDEQGEPFYYQHQYYVSYVYYIQILYIIYMICNMCILYTSMICNMCILYTSIWYVICVYYIQVYIWYVICVYYIQVIYNDVPPSFSQHVFMLIYIYLH